MDGDVLPVPAQLQAWRAHGADRMDPMRFGFIEALALRTRAQEGEARRLLDARLSGLMRTYADDLLRWRSLAESITDPASSTSNGCALRQLVALLQHRASPSEAPEATRGNVPTAVPAGLEEARRLWTQVRTESQLRASLDDVPADAGPLNSSMLVHRALHFMRAASPGYLQHFIAYADTLSSLERLQQEMGPLKTGAADGGKPASRARKRRA